MYHELSLSNVFTFESSFFGASHPGTERRHFTQDDFRRLGATICQALYRVLKLEVDFLKEPANNVQENGN
jgi:hypothetical protein